MLLAYLIAKQRTKTAAEIYEHLGGGSPILQNTLDQARALEYMLSAHGKFKVFISMRYWHPFADETIKQVEKYKPDRVILLPLYPQFSSSTTASSISNWRAHAGRLNAKELVVCCYPSSECFISRYISLIKPALKKAARYGAPRLLFSAHGLPVRNIKNGDPYQWQIEQTVSSIVEGLSMPELDFKICYQSRVGRLKWLTPYIQDEIANAGKEKVPLVVVPISFVSEHSETLVELDIEYKTLAESIGVPAFIRVPTVSTHPQFISALAELCLATVQGKRQQQICPAICSKCFCKGRSC
jgi:ferrochelatase